MRTPAKVIHITTRQPPNAFYIQSYRLHNTPILAILQKAISLNFRLSVLIQSLRPESMSAGE